MNLSLGRNLARIFLYLIAIEINAVICDQTALKFINNFDKIFGIGQKLSKEYVMPYFRKLSTSIELSDRCRKTLNSMLEHPEQEWSSLMINSNGRLINSGFLSGTITDYGDFDQCIAIDHRDISGTRIHGQYCLMSLRLPIASSDVEIDFNGTRYENSWASKRFDKIRHRFFHRIVSALCFPSQCRSDEIQSLARKVFETFDLVVDLEACQTKQTEVNWNFAQILSISILTVCMLTVIIGTCYANCFKTSNTYANMFATSFDLIANTQTLLSIKEPQSNELASIHGIRFLLIMWVITCHTTNFAPLGLYDQPMIAARFADRIDIVREFWTQFVISGSLSVQAFFIISGLISLYTALKNQSIFLKSVPYWKYVLLRWLRFAPPLLGMFCFQFLWPSIRSGPLMHWDYIRYGHQPCYQSWWANFLFLSNWLPLTKQCGSHTWFLSADFQINLIAYFFILAYIKDFRKGFILNLIALIISMIAPSLINWYYGIPLVHILEPDIQKLNHSFNMIEFNTYNHFAAYLAGFLVAASLTRTSYRNHFTEKTRTFCWWIAIVLILILPFSTYPFIQMEKIPSSFLSLIYTGIKRGLWIVAISWIIYGTCSGCDESLITKFLSAKIFQPFSRLTFSIYLTQSLVVWFFAYQSRQLHTISHFDTIFRIGGVTLYSILLAYSLYILFEAPAVNLCKMIFKRHQDKISSMSPNDSIRNKKQN